MVRRLCADDVGRLKALRAFQQIELYGLTLVQGAVAVFLNRGKVYGWSGSQRARCYGLPGSAAEIHSALLPSGGATCYGLPGSAADIHSSVPVRVQPASYGLPGSAAEIHSGIKRFDTWPGLWFAGKRR